MSSVNERTIYLITGANRGVSDCHSSLLIHPKRTYLLFIRLIGIGLALVKIFLARANVVVIAAVRDPLDRSSMAPLSSIICGTNSQLITIRINSLDSTSSSTTISSIPESIDHLDIVIANAGVLHHYGPVIAMPVDMLPHHFTINTAAPISLLQACLPLLKKSKKSNCPKFIVISSSVGSVTQVGSSPNSQERMGLVKLQLTTSCAKFILKNLGYHLW